MITVEQYERKKNDLCAKLRASRDVRLGKETSNLFRHRRDASGPRIDVRHFNNVIAIDREALTADVEGMTPYETFVDETLPLGLRPTVIPEFKTITVGGAATGIGLEASSFKFGFVHETVLEIEVLLPDGRVVVCSETENSDLFFGFPNSYGTLGYALRLRVQLVPVKPFVKVNHRRFTAFGAYFDAMKTACGETFDFIDGTIFSSREMYLTTGAEVDAAPYTSDYSYMQIYYKSIRERSEDFLSAYNFLWRWDTDWYWGSKKFGAQNPLVRALLGRERLRSSFYWKLRAALNRTPFWKLIAPVLDYETVVQDVDIPIEHAAEFMNFQSEEIGITPVWACPVNEVHKNFAYPLYAVSPSTTYVNLGFWDIVRTHHEPGHFNRLVEKKVMELGGRKILYSDAFFTPDEFSALYGGEIYSALKEKYDPRHTFKSLYEKCVAGK